MVIGGGVIGLSIARELHKRGVRSIVLLEKSFVGQESSWAAAGMLGPQAEANSGGAFFDMTVASRDLYPDFASELLDETGIDVELERSGTLSLAFTDEDTDELSRRYKWQSDSGFPVENLTSEEIIKAEPFVSPIARSGLFFPRDWQVENRKLLAALRRYADLNGITICEDTGVERLLIDDGRVIGAEANGKRYLADKTVLATGAWTSLIKLGSASFPVQIEPIRGQMICMKAEPGSFRHVIYSRRGYIVPRADGRILAGSTSENVGFEKSVTDEAMTSLRKMALEISPFLDGLKVADRWCGFRPFASDGLPVLGKIPEYKNLLIATAHYRNGILLAPITAKIIAEKIVNFADSEYFRHFGPQRFSNTAEAAGG